MDAAVDFYNSIYKANPHKWAHPARDEFAYHALSGIIPEPASVLDVGCGNGHTLKYLSGFWPETEFYGVDISDVALELAQKRLPGSKFYQNLDDAPRCNLVVMLGVLEHFQNLSDLARVAGHIAPAGTLYIEVPNCLSYSSSREEGFRRTTGGTGQNEWHLTRKSWEKVLADNGLEIVSNITGPVAAWEFIFVVKNPAL